MIFSEISGRPNFHKQPPSPRPGMSEISKPPLNMVILDQYVPCLATAVIFFAIRQVEQGPETARFRIGSTLHSCQYQYISS